MGMQLLLPNCLEESLQCQSKLSTMHNKAYHGCDEAAMTLSIPKTKISLGWLQGKSGTHVKNYLSPS